jgi:uncharacterized protein (DUF1501 family)
MNHITRRRFLHSSAVGAAAIGLNAVVPHTLLSAALRNTSDRILVVVELNGGNDGLNTVIPARDDRYQKLRPKLAVPVDSALSIDSELGFHSALRGFAELLEQGKLSIIQGVGYPNPNRSHFESMDIWHTCLRKDDSRTDGWLGRMLEVRPTTAGGDPPALHLGPEKQPFSLMSRSVRVPSIRSLEQFRLDGADDGSFRDLITALSAAERPAENDLLNFVQSSTSSAIAASQRLSASVAGDATAVSYPQSPLGQQLKSVAKLIRSGLKSSVYYVQLNGFDTHSQQDAVHQALLRQLGDAVSAFMQELGELGESDRVLLMSFSEFGRRVEENASEGTDHGTAGPMFLAGSQVLPGLIGTHPSLSELEDGDLKHHTDFRQVYATVLKDWFQCDPSEIVKGQFAPLSLLRSA